MTLRKSIGTIEFLTNRFQIRELTLILSLFFIIFEVSSVFGEKYSPILNIFVLIPSTTLPFYASLSSFSFGQRIETGYIGFIFTMPVRRQILLSAMALFEILIVPTYIWAAGFLIIYLNSFIIPINLMIYGWLLLVSWFAFTVSLGRIYGAVSRNGLISFALTFGTILAISNIDGNKELSRFILLFISTKFFILSSQHVFLLLISLAVSSVLIAVSNFITLHSDLKSGR